MFAEKISKLLVSGSLLASAFASVPASALESLPSYNVNLEESSISGVSAGGFMAGQFHIAFSSKLKGVGIIAGGPYNCAQGSLYQATTQAGGWDGRCMEHPDLLTDAFLDELYQDALDLEAKGSIDSLENIMDDKVFIFHGTLDITVKTPVGDTIEPWYLKTGMSKGNIKYERFETGHTYPTDSFGNPCEFDTEPPWVSNCGYDGAGETLKHIYGDLNPRNDSGQLTGKFIEFDQSEFLDPAPNSMQPKGVAYVPESCTYGEECRIHTFFHGCEQVYDSVPADRFGDNSSYDGKGIWSKPYPKMGDTIWKNSGLNKWADTNNFIILYPQAKKSYAPFNPKGCWDWWGYINSGGAYDYATKNGPQMKGIMKMMERLAEGYDGGEGEPEDTTPPAKVSGLKVMDVTHTTAIISWDDNSEDDLYGYLVYIAEDGGSKHLLTVEPQVDSDFFISTLEPSTSYTFTVVAIDHSGNISESAETDVMTTVAQGSEGEPEEGDPEEGDPEEGDPEGMSDDEGSSEKGGSIGFYLLSMLLVISWRRKRKV